MTATCGLLAAGTAGGFLFQLVGLPLPSTLGAMSAAGPGDGRRELAVERIEPLSAANLHGSLIIRQKLR